MVYRLKIQQIHSVCLFELTWGRSQCLQAQVFYPAQLETRYQQWQRAYLNFYRQALRGQAGTAAPVEGEQLGEKTALRGRPGATGVAATPVDWHQHLVDAEGQLLLEFHRWLKQGELTDIRRTLSITAKEAPVDLFLTCTPIEIARLPWETWEIGAEYGGVPIRISRSPINIPVTATAPAAQSGKTRVLAIIGDETGLDFSGDRAALQSLERLLDITFIGWTPGQDATALRTAICQAIADPQGWDVLFFAGHSNEADVVAGHIYVAPNTALSIYELKPYLQAAQENGLQFAFFNSCSGLTIADALIELGLSQVAVMREPIHNQVAHAFLLTFLQSLAHHEDAHTALQAACRYLKLEQHLTFPSAYLVPSLFRHPDSVPFHIPERGWRQELRRWLPSKQQAIALGSVLVLSVIPGAQEALLSGRLLAQAMYRNLTGQMPTAPPEVVLVQVDEASRRRAPELVNISPINQEYLADLVDSLSRLDATVVGIDYLLDLPNPEQSQVLAAATRRAVGESEMWLIFSAILEGGREISTHADSQIISPNWAMAGYTNAPNWYMALPWGTETCQRECPFPYLLAAAAQASDSQAFPQPALTRQTSLRSELITTLLDSDIPSHQTLARRRILPVTTIGGKFRQRWLRPILDFSLPPDRIFHRVSAYELLVDTVDDETAEAIAQSSVVLIGGVGYVEGGVDPLSTDISPNPPTIAYWRQWKRDDSEEKTFAGVEAIAYDVHHFLQSHYVTPVPALWVVGIAAGLGAGITLYGIPQLNSSRQGLWLLAGATAGYGWLSFQLMIGTGLLLPWLLPSATVWIYVLPKIWRLPT
ncbi:MAG: CHASE2 domain-containing protein [Leptolyngbya sp. SIO1E4]|nr:CHASE2 domain-containing protein [Leptolyngbya sp. SIO1E4]